MSFTKKIRTGARGKAALAVLGVLIAAVALVAWAGSSPASGEASAVWPGAARMGGERRRVACAQLRPREHSAPRPRRRSTPRPSRTLKVKWRFALKGASAFGDLRLDADRPQRHRLFPGPELERLRARPLDRQARVEAHVQQAERRPEWNRLRLRPHLRRDSDGRLRARSADREAGLGAQADPQQQRGHRHDAPALRQHRRLQHGAGQRLVLLRRQRRRRSFGHSTPPPARRSGSSTRSSTAPSCSATRRSTAAAASGTRPRSTARDASSSPSPTRRRCTARRSSPNGSSRPGPNLYTNSLVALDGQTGKLLWFRQAVPHDVRDYDLMIPRSSRRCRSRASRPRSCWSPARWARPTPTAPTTDSASGRARSASTRTTPDRCRARPYDDLPGRPRRRRDADGARREPSLRALARLPAHASATGLGRERLRPPASARAAAGFTADRRRHRQGALAAEAAVDGLRRRRRSPTMSSSRAITPARSTRFDTQTGKTLWTAKAPAGINSFPAIDGDTLLVGAAAPGFLKKPQFQLIAYSLQP